MARGPSSTPYRGVALLALARGMFKANRRVIARRGRGGLVRVGFVEFVQISSVSGKMVNRRV